MAADPAAVSHAVICFPVSGANAPPSGSLTAAWGDDAELLKQTKHIELDPLFRKLAIRSSIVVFRSGKAVKKADVNCLNASDQGPISLC